MKTAPFVLAAALGLAPAAPALAQSSAGVTTTPDGRLLGSANAGAAPPVSVEAGGGRTRVEGGWPTGYGSGRSVTVNGPNSSASAGAWTSGGGATSVYGSGSPGSDIRYHNSVRREAYAYGRYGPHHHRHWRRRNRP